tara:strand:+ start:1096 stop:3036 length:1941 start_codon:yes stop_codon:yes gene_type:complete
MAQELEMELKVNANQADGKLNDIASEIKTINKHLKETQKKGDKALESIGKEAKKASKQTEKLEKGFSRIGGLLKAGLGLAILQKGMSMLSDTFSQNQRTQDELNVQTGILRASFTQFVDGLWTAYDAATSVGGIFENIGNMFRNWWNGTLKDGQIRVEQMALAWNKANLAVQDFFGADPKKLEELNNKVKESEQTLRQLQDEFNQTASNQKKTLDTIKNQGNEIGKNFAKTIQFDYDAERKRQREIVELRKKSALDAAENEKLIFQKQREAEVLRQTRDDIRKPLEERLKANDELKKVLEEQEAMMRKNAQSALDLAQKQLATDKTNLEFQLEVLRAEKELLDIDEMKEGFMSEQLTNEASLQEEIKDRLQTEVEGENIRVIEKKKANAELIKDEVLRIEALKVINEEEKVLEQERLQAVIDNAHAGTQAKVDAEQALYDFQSQNKIEQDQLDLQLAEAKKQRVKEGLDAVINAAGAESKVGRALMIAKQVLAAKELIMNAKSQIAKANDTVVKAGLNAAEASTEVAKGGAKAAAAAPPPLNVPFILSFAATAVGIVAAMKSAVKSAKTAASAAGGGGSSIGDIQAPKPSTSAAPTFNVVGASGTNQLAETIAGKQNSPLKAFVVSKEVSTAQEMDRNIVQSASIG